MQTLHRTAKSAARSSLILQYSKDCPLLGRYLSLNKIEAFTITRHHLGDKGWQVWEGPKDSSGGWPQGFTTLKAAKEFAARMSQHTGLPVIDHSGK